MCEHLRTLPDSAVIGFCTIGKPREFPDQFSYELRAIYLLKSHHGRGIGTALYASVFRDLGSTFGMA
jgi:GNAT superfamily N-acetyltransferase